MNTPISRVGRALQATMQNLSPQQQQAYVAAPHGGISALQLIPLHQQLQQMQQALPKEVPPQRTVAQDLGAQMQAMAIPRAAGVAGLPVQNVGRPQNYAGGGIVAFQEGGSTADIEEQIKNLEQDIAESDYIFSGAPMAGQPAQSPVNWLGRAIQMRANPFGSAGKAGSEARRRAEARLEGLRRLLADQRFKQAQPAGGPTTRYTAAKREGVLSAVPEVERAAAEPTAGLAAVAPRQPSPAAAPTTTAAAIPTAPEMTRDEFLAQVEADAARSGLGKTAEARRKYLEGLQAAEKGRKGKDIAQALMKSGIGMMSAAARPGATFAQALAGGAAAGSEAMETLEAKREERAARLQEMQFAIDEADELRKAGYIKEADAKKREADAIKRDLDKEARLFAQQTKLEQMQQAGATSRAQMQESGATQRARETIGAARDRAILEMPAAQRLQNMWIAEKDPAKKAAIARDLEAVIRQSPSYAAVVDKLRMQQEAEAALFGVGISKGGDSQSSVRTEADRILAGG